MNLTSEEGWLSPQVQFKRIAEYEARGHFEPIHLSTTTLEYTAVKLIKPNTPRFLVDRIIESSYLKAVKRLKEEVEK